MSQWFCGRARSPFRKHLARYKLRACVYAFRKGRSHFKRVSFKIILQKISLYGSYLLSRRRHRDNKSFKSITKRTCVCIIWDLCVFLVRVRVKHNIAAVQWEYGQFFSSRGTPTQPPEKWVCARSGMRSTLRERYSRTFLCVLCIL